MKRQLVPYDGDVLRDIGDVPFSEFWRRCEDLLPTDWAMQLTVRQHEGFPVYIVVAFLIPDEDAPEETNVGFQTGSSTAERAIERMYYILREGLPAPSGAVEFSGLPPAIRESDSLGE